MVGIKRKQEIAVRAAVVSEILVRRGISHVPTSLGDDGFSFQVSTSQDLGEVLEEVYLKWPDVLTVYVHPVGASLSLSIKLEMKEFQDV